MIIDKFLFNKLERLAKLKFDETDRPEILKDMEKVLEYMKLLDDIDVGTAEPMVSPIMVFPVETKNVLREDIPEKGMTREEFLKNAKNIKENQIAVPEIF